MRTQVCSIYLLEEDGETLVLTATNGLSQEGVGNARLRLGEGVTGWAAAERRPAVVPDVRAEARFRWLAGVDQARFVSMCSVPIVSSDRLVGVINVQTDALRGFTDPEVAFLAAIAAQVAGVLERSELQSRLEERLADLRRSDEIHRRFTALALAGAGPGAICAAIERLAGAPVAVYDEDGERLAGASEGLPAVLEGFADPERRTDALTILPIRAGRDLLGWLAAGSGARAGTAVRRQALEHGVTVLALELVRERAAAEAERRLRGDLLEELLSVRLTPVDAARLARRAARLGYRIRGPVWVLALEPDDAESAHALSGRTARRRLVRALAALLAQRHAGGLVVERAGALVLLVPGEPSLAEVEDLARSAIGAAGQQAPGSSLSCAVSSEAAGPAELHRLAEEARHALQVARRMGRRGTVASYGRLGVERLLLEIERPERLAAYVDEWLGPLLRHDAAGRGAAPLVETIDALVTETWSLRATARRLLVHVNTLRYRMERAERITGRSLEDPEVRLGLGLALRAWALLGTLDEAPEEPPEQSQTSDPYPPRATGSYAAGRVDI
jgi:DNA-binding PucR family transcriptional regulator